MDWLTTNGVLIDYGKQKVVFPVKEQMQTISSREVLQNIQEKCVCFVVITTKKKNSAEEKIVGIHVVEEFVDVFQGEVLGLPPSQEVDFAINLCLEQDQCLWNPNTVNLFRN